jgi:PAS domain S-box-containing protein
MEPWQTPQTNLTDIPIAQELSRRIPRSPDLQAENRALQILARQLATSPRTLLKTLVAIAQDLCRAGSVGVCLLEENATSEQIYRWEALAGAWEAAEQTNTLSRLQLSGADRDLETPQLYFHPEQSFIGLPKPELPIAEALVVPLLAADRRLGAIWIVSHDRDRQFDAEDLRIAIALADFAVAALQIDRADRTKEALRESEERWQLACAGNSDGIWDHNLQTNCCVGSDRCLEILECDRQEFYRFSEYLTWIHPDDLERVQSNWQQHLNRETSHYCCEYRIRCRDGRYKWVSARGRAIWDESGNPVRAVGSMTDISDRKQAELDLLASNERFQLATRAIDGIVFEWDLASNSVYRSEGLSSLIGVRAEDAPTTPEWWKERIHPVDLARIEAEPKLILNLDRYEGEYRVRHEDGRWIDVWERGCTIRNQQGEATKVVGFTTEITQRKQAEAALRDRETRLQLILDSAKDYAIITLDTSGGVTSWNAGAERLLGYAEAEIVGYDGRIIFTPEDSAAGKPELEMHLALTQGKGENERWHVRQDGSRFWGSGLMMPLHGAADQVQGFLKIMQDKTDRRQIEEALRQSENRYRTLADAVPQLMWINTADRLEFCNQHWQNYTGIVPAELPMAAPMEIVHPLELETVTATRNQAIQAGEFYELECRVLRFDGIYRWHLVRVVPLKDSGGQVVQCVGIGIDIDDRKRAEESLAESDRRFRFLAESLPHLIWNVDSAGEIRFANQKWSEYLGMSYAEAAQNNWESLVPPSDLAEGLARWRESLITGEDYQAEFRLRRASDGMDRWHLSRAVPIRGRDGEIVEWIGTNTDIHDRKIAQLNEQFLSELELRLRQHSDPAEMLWEAMHSLAEYLQVDRCIWNEIDVEADRAIAQQDWHQPELISVVGTYQLSDFNTPERKSFYMAGQTAVISDIAKDPQTADAVDNYRALSVRAMLGVPCLEEGRWVALLVVTSQAVRHWRADEVSVMQEVVARLWPAIGHARAVQDLHESEDRFRALADNIAQLAWMTDASGGIFWYNQRWFDYTGTTLEEMQGWGWQQVHHPEHVDRVVAKFRRCIETGEPWEDTFPLRGKDGSYRWFLSRAVPIRDAQGNVLRWCGTNTDITDRLNAEAERERLLALEKAARAEAERANRVKDEFLAVLSHELRTPLNPIMGWTKLLRSNCLTPQKQLYALETIERNAKLQTQLIEDLLDVSGILQGKVSLNIVPVDLVGAIGSAIETVRLSAEVKSIQICTQFAPDIGRVLGDARRLQQVVWNLLSNAVKFTSPGGKIAVKLDRLDTRAQITVTDTGKGIEPDFLPYVFDYFRQADSTFTRKFGGLGLGLAIVRHLVELHGGTVKADSPGEAQGATFTVRIPLMPVQPPTIPAETAPQESFNLSGIRVLAVDDDTDARDLVVFLLEDCGASVTAVSNADDALAVLTQSVPDVLLSDIGMPDTDGYK